MIQEMLRSKKCDTKFIICPIKWSTESILGKKNPQQISHLVWDALPESKGQREEHNNEYKVVMTCRLFNVWRKDHRKVIFLNTKKLWAMERTKYKE